MRLIMGLPNAGKTTYSKKYKNVIHLDELEGFDRLEKVIESIKEKSNITVEGIFLSAKIRKKLIEASTSKTNTCIWINTPEEVCLNRRGRPNILVEACIKSLEPPTKEEGWDDINIITDCYEEENN